MTKIINLSIRLALLFILLAELCSAQETSWFEKLKLIEPLKSAEKDIERLYGKPTDSYSNIAEYENEAGELTVYYSEGKCCTNEESEYDVEKGVVVDFDFSVRNEIKFKSLNINLVGFVKEYSSDADGAFSYKNEALGINYSLYRDRLTFISVSPAKSYAYLACPKKPKESEPIIDDVDQPTFIKLTQLKVLQNDRSDVLALFGAPFKSENDGFDFYLGEKYGFGFIYSTGKCSLLNEDIWNIPKGKIINIVIIFDRNGVTSTLDLSKLNKKREDNGFAYYENKEEGVEYKIKNDRIWRIEYSPNTKKSELKCVK